MGVSGYTGAAGGMRGEAAPGNQSRGFADTRRAGSRGREGAAAVLPLTSRTGVPTSGPAPGSPSRTAQRTVSEWCAAGAPASPPRGSALAARAGWSRAQGSACPPRRLTQKFPLNSEPVMAGASAGAEESGVAATGARKLVVKASSHPRSPTSELQRPPRGPTPGPKPRPMPSAALVRPASHPTGT